MSESRLKRIVVYYLPSLHIPPDTFETAGRAGYHIHADEQGVIGYRIWFDQTTVLIPRDHVQKIVADLPGPG